MEFELREMVRNCPKGVAEFKRIWIHFYTYAVTFIYIDNLYIFIVTLYTYEVTPYSYEISSYVFRLNP